MKGFVVTVDFKLKSGVMDRFRSLVQSNANDSCRLEQGCRRFDVMEPEAESDRIFLYEIYDSRTAFDIHLKSQHFDAFNRLSSDLVLSKHVNFLSLICEGSNSEST